MATVRTPRITTRAQEAAKRTAARTVANELDDILNEVGSHDEMPSASSVRAVNRERSRRHVSPGKQLRPAASSKPNDTPSSAEGVNRHDGDDGARQGSTIMRTKAVDATGGHEATRLSERARRHADNDGVPAVDTVRQRIELYEEQELGASPVLKSGQNKATTSIATADRQQAIFRVERNGVTVELIVGDITQQSIEAIVDPANNALVPGGGVSKGLANAAGAEYRKECGNWIKRHGAIQDTECCVTGAGQLSALFVIHAVSIKADDCKDEDHMSAQLLDTHLNVFAAAGELQISSMAFPALGADLNNVPINVAANAAATATMIRIANQERTGDGIKLIRFVLSDLKHQVAYKLAMREAGLYSEAVDKVRANRLQDLSGQHTADAEMNRVLQQWQLEQNTAKQPEVTGYRYGSDDDVTVMTTNDEGSMTDGSESSVSRGRTKRRTERVRRNDDSKGGRTGKRKAVTFKTRTTDSISADKAVTINKRHNVDNSNDREHECIVSRPKKNNGATNSELSNDETEGESSLDEDDYQTDGSRRRHKVRSDVKPRPFNGDGYVEQYLAQFKYTAALAHWPKKEWGLQLIAALEGKARRVITEHHLPLTDRPSFDKVAQLLRESFGSDASPDVWLTTLERRKRHDKETLTELSQAMMELVGKAFPDVNWRERERVAVGYFVRALREPQHRVHIMASCPKSLTEALQVAIAYENAERVGADERPRAQSQTKVRAYESNEASEPVVSAPLQKKGVKKVETSQGHDHDTPPYTALPSPAPQQSGNDVTSRGGYRHRGRGRGRGGRQAADAGWLQVVRTLTTQIGDLHTAAHQPPVGNSNADAQRTPLYKQNNGRCFNCNETGHFARNCPYPSNGEGHEGQGNGRGRGRNGHLPGRGQW